MIFLLLLAAQDTAYRRVAVAHPAAITVDGALDDWSPGLFAVSAAIDLAASVSFVEEGTLDPDTHATLFLAYGKRELYVAAIVRDDRVVSDGWKGDMIELLVAGLHIGITPDGRIEQFQPRGPTSVTAKGSVQAPGYVIEARVPLERSLKAGDTLRLGLAMKDADPDEPPARAVWSGYRSNKEASFGELVLREPPPVRSADLSRCPKGNAVTVRAPITVKDLSPGGPVRLRIMNFQSAKKSWGTFWSDFDAAQVGRDLDVARALGANTVRVFPPYATAPLEPLKTLVGLAKKRGLLVIPSLFPDKKEFQKDRYAAMEAHATKMAAAFKGEPAIAMWDLMNEADHGFGLEDAIFTADEVYAWAKHMAAAVKKADPSHLVTIGLAGYFAFREGPLKPEEVMLVGDVLSLHWYFAPGQIARGLERAKEASRGAPVILQEVGVSSMYEDEASATQFYDGMCTVAERAGVSGFGAWELFDHPVGTIDFLTPRYRETDENHFGLARSDGSLKAQAAAYCRCLSNVPRFVIE